MTGANNEGVWAYDASGDGVLVIRKGDSGAPFGFSATTITAVNFMGQGAGNRRASIDDGAPLAFNDRSDWCTYSSSQTAARPSSSPRPALGCTPIFADGFESGDTKAWTP